MINFFIHKRFLLLICTAIFFAMVIAAYNAFYTTDNPKDKKIFLSLIPAYFGFSISIYKFFKDYILESYPIFLIDQIHFNEDGAIVKIKAYNNSTKKNITLKSLKIDKSPITPLNQTIGTETSYTLETRVLGIDKNQSSNELNLILTYDRGLSSNKVVLKHVTD